MKKNTGLGISDYATILTLMFVALKLTGNIDWSWWWVLSPVWFCVFLGMILVTGCFIFVVAKRHE